MAFSALLVGLEESAELILLRAWAEFDCKVECCPGFPKAAARLLEKHFGAVVVGGDSQSQISPLLREMRLSPLNQSAVAIAILDRHEGLREMFSLGVNFVLYQPVSYERAVGSLRAASLLLQREKRRNRRVAVHAGVKLDYANVENVSATLIDLSEEGSAVQSEKKLPPDCRVYFQFALPGHTSLIRLAAEVVWQDSTGRVGVRFVNVPTSSRRVLRTWLDANQPAAVSAAPQVPRPEAIAKTRPAVHENEDTLQSRLRSKPGNRRTQSRHACCLGAEVYRLGVPVPSRCSLTDISSGGCYVEMPTPLPAGTRVEIVVRAEQMKLRLQGVVQSVHPGFGMGVQLVLKTTEHHDHLQSLIRLLEESAQASEVTPSNDPWIR